MIPDIYYHVYNRGAHKADIFLDGSDYVRMLKLLYIANNDAPFIMEQLPDNIFGVKRNRILVDIVAYCLMPNHIHIVLKKRLQIESSAVDSIARFIHKLATGYTVYFNNKYGHSGTIWQGSYKEKIVYDGLYIQTLIKYVHLNPRSLINPDMSKPSCDKNDAETNEFVMKYEYSSIKDYNGIIRPQRSILNVSELLPFQVG